MNSKMTFYILKRILLAILTVWIVITVTFCVMHAIPGGPFVSEKAISKEAQAALEDETADPEVQSAVAADGWSFLKLNDRIITGGRNLYEGKVIA